MDCGCASSSSCRAFAESERSFGHAPKQGGARAREGQRHLSTQRQLQGFCPGAQWASSAQAVGLAKSKSHLVSHESLLLGSLWGVAREGPGTLFLWALGTWLPLSCCSAWGGPDNHSATLLCVSSVFCKSSTQHKRLGLGAALGFLLGQASGHLMLWDSLCSSLPSSLTDPSVHLSITLPDGGHFSFNSVPFIPRSGLGIQ